MLTSRAAAVAGSRALRSTTHLAGTPVVSTQRCPTAPRRAEFQRQNYVFAKLAGLFHKEPTGRNGRAPLVKGTVSPLRDVPAHIKRPPYVGLRDPPFNTTYQKHDERARFPELSRGIVKMEAAGKLAAEVLEKAGKMVKAGITTEEIDVAVHNWIVEAGAYPSPLQYGGFPKSVCTSLNECICHGIPDSTVIQDGDIINVDVTVYLDGYHGDTSRTFLVGTVDAEAQQLVAVTEEALARAISICGPGVPIKQIGATIHAFADTYGYGVVEAFVGHGVGRDFHSAPTVIHCRNSVPGLMEPGMTFTIEPMLTMGGTRERGWSDNWTMVTADGSWTAQFEHTLLITKDGCRVLTVTGEGGGAALKPGSLAEGPKGQGVAALGLDALLGGGAKQQAGKGAELAKPKGKGFGKAK